jgi:hypothetical protein
VEGIKVQFKVLGPYANAVSPTLNLQVEFSSLLDEGQITILPMVCEMFLAQPKEMYIGNASIYQEGSSRSHLQEVQVGPRSSLTLGSRFELGFAKINAVENQRRELPKKDVHLKVGMYGWLLTEKQIIKTLATRIDNIVIPESEWVDWLKSWGKETRLVSLSGSVVKRFDELKTAWKINDDSELVSLMTDRLRETQFEKKDEFLCTLPHTRTIESRIKDMLTRASSASEVMIAGWVDQVLEPAIKQLAERKVAIRLIIPKGATKLPSREVKDALSRVAGYGVQVRENDWLHGRVLIIDDNEAVVSSADLKTDSLAKNREAGIYTTDPTTVRHVAEFFDIVWSEGSPHT